VAAALGEREAGERLVAGLLARLDALRATTAGVRHRPTVVCLEWVDPLMFAANWVPDLVGSAGGTTPFGQSGDHSGYLTFEQLTDADPDVIAVMPCGFDIPRTLAEMGAITARPEWSALRAVRHGRVAITDGNQYFNRPGPRVVDSAEILAELLHPDACRFGHEGSGWTWWRADLPPARP
jgi:iron complex transport system substrate-binding protein